MLAARLISIGFTQNEANTYLALARRGRTDANTLIKDTGMHKKIVYENLEKLGNKGLLTVSTEQHRRIYSLANPEHLYTLLQEEQQTLDKKTITAEHIINDIKKLTPPRPHNQEAEVLRGTRGVRNFYQELLAQGDDYVGFGGPRASLTIMGEHFWMNTLAKMEEQNIKARFIFNASLRDYGERIRNERAEVRFFHQDQEPLTETHIRPGVVSFIVWTENPVVFLIRDPVVAESYMDYFENLWKQAQE